MTHEKKLLTEREIEERYGIKIKTLQKHRFQRKGLPYVRIGGAVRYPLDAVEAFIQDHSIQPEGI